MPLPQSITPDQLARSWTIMTDFLCDQDLGFKTFAQLVPIFARDREALERDGDPSNDLRTLGYEGNMMRGEWKGPIVFLRDDGGLIGDGIHRGIAYLRCIANGAEPARLPQLHLGPPDSYVWPRDLKEYLIDRQRDG
jgi:hypothetical protein